MTSASRAALARVDQSGIRPVRRALGEASAVPTSRALPQVGQHAIGCPPF